jgi:hypothetical protein
MWLVSATGDTVSAVAMEADIKAQRVRRLRRVDDRLGAQLAKPARHIELTSE